MSCSSDSPEALWVSTVESASEAVPGARYRVRRMSLGRRNALIRSVRELAQRAEFHSAGEALEERLEASALALEIDAVYLRWGLAGIDGLTIDGQPATAELLIADGPEELAREIATAVKAQCSLSDDERKN
jgi:hypothetical protein